MIAAKPMPGFAAIFCIPSHHDVTFICKSKEEKGPGVKEPTAASGGNREADE